jgi:sulfur transfer complex TusBCD TusB component (DsrH family)
MRAARGFVLPAVLLAVATVAALLAVDVHRWDRALTEGDAVYAATPQRASWQTSTVLPADPAERLLALSDDIAARGALQLFLATAHRRARLDNAVDVAADRARTETALAAVAQSGGAPRSAQARTLLGILTFEDFARGGDDAGQAEAAISYFDAAVRSDPTSEAASFDLELALRALAARGVRVGPGSGTATSATGRKGAGGGLPGRGY